MGVGRAVALRRGVGPAVEEAAWEAMWVAVGLADGVAVNVMRAGRSGKGVATGEGMGVVVVLKRGVGVAVAEGAGATNLWGGDAVCSRELSGVACCGEEYAIWAVSFGPKYVEITVHAPHKPKNKASRRTRPCHRVWGLLRRKVASPAADCRQVICVSPNHNRSPSSKMVMARRGRPFSHTTAFRFSLATRQFWPSYWMMAWRGATSASRRRTSQAASLPMVRLG